jgi:hypothetical protein
MSFLHGGQGFPDFLAALGRRAVGVAREGRTWRKLEAVGYVVMTFLLVTDL